MPGHPCRALCSRPFHGRTGRAHRIGQSQPVFIYKLICEDTLDEKIQRLQQHNDALAAGLRHGDDASEPR